MDTKQCHHCREIKPETDFVRKTQSPFGTCRVCYNKREKERKEQSAGSTYISYLKKAGMYEYYKKSRKYQV